MGQLQSLHAPEPIRHQAAHMLQLRPNEAREINTNTFSKIKYLFNFPYSVYIFPRRQYKFYFYLGFLSLSLPEFLTLSLSGTLGLSNFSLKSLLSKRKEALYLDPVF